MLYVSERAFPIPLTHFNKVFVLRPVADIYPLEFDNLRAELHPFGGVLTIEFVRVYRASYLRHSSAVFGKDIGKETLFVLDNKGGIVTIDGKHHPLRFKPFVYWVAVTGHPHLHNHLTRKHPYPIWLFKCALSFFEQPPLRARRSPRYPSLLK